MDTAIQKANEKMTFLSNDKEVLRLYHMREMAQIDFDSGMKRARDEGKREGIEEGKRAGIEEGKLETARQMKADGEPVEKIIRYTGLTKACIENLQETRREPDAGAGRKNEDK